MSISPRSRKVKPLTVIGLCIMLLKFLKRQVLTKAMSAWPLLMPILWSLNYTSSNSMIDCFVSLRNSKIQFSALRRSMVVITTTLLPLFARMMICISKLISGLCTATRTYRLPFPTTHSLTNWVRALIFMTPMQMLFVMTFIFKKKGILMSNCALNQCPYLSTSSI